MECSEPKKFPHFLDELEVRNRFCCIAGRGRFRFWMWRNQAGNGARSMGKVESLGNQGPKMNCFVFPGDF